MSVTSEVKSRGMKFAEEQLLKHGWTHGDPQWVPPHPPKPLPALCPGQRCHLHEPCAVRSAVGEKAVWKESLQRKVLISRKGKKRKYLTVNRKKEEVGRSGE